MHLGHAVGVLQSGAARRRAARGQPAEHVRDLAALRHARGFERDARLRRIGHDADRVVRLQFVEQHAEGILQQRQPVLRRHGAGHVDEEHQVRARALLRRDLVALDGDVHQLVGWLPRRRHHGHRWLERRCGAFGARIGVGEIIDHLLDAHGIFRRHAAGHQAAAHEAVGGRVHIDGEGRDGLRRHLLDRVRGEGLELVAVLLWRNGLLGHSRRRRCIPRTLRRPITGRGSFTSEFRGSAKAKCLRLVKDSGLPATSLSRRRRCGWLGRAGTDNGPAGAGAAAGAGRGVYAGTVTPGAGSAAGRPGVAVTVGEATCAGTADGEEAIAIRLALTASSTLFAVPVTKSVWLTRLICKADFGLS